jgi:hypothetical protein
MAADQSQTERVLWRGYEASLAIVAAGLAALAAGPVLSLAAALGRFVPASDVGVDYAKGVLWAALLGATILLWPVRHDERVALGVIWVAKCAVVLGFMLFYEWNYEALDAYGYFAASRDSAFGPIALGFGTGTQLIYALTRLHSEWLVTSYHAVKVSFSMIGLLAIFIFYRAAVLAMGERRLWLLYVLGLLPSILFWSSILGKDPIAFIGIALFTYGIVSWLVTKRYSGLLIAACGLLVAVSVRLWLGPILVGPAVVAGLWGIRGPTQRLLVLAVGVAVLAAFVTLLRNYFLIQTLADTLMTVGTMSRSWATGGSAQVVQGDLSRPVQLLMFLPRGIFAALLRPLPGEVLNAFGLLAGLENLALLVLAVLAIARTRLGELRAPVVTWAVSFVLFWAAVYGPISYQNLGTGVRFRLQVLPVFLLLLLYLARPRQRSTAKLASASL